MKELNPVKFLILSDIHYGSLAISSDFGLRNGTIEYHNSISMKKNLIDLLKYENIDIMIILGDITSTARPSEFIECSNVINEIADELKVTRDNIIYTFGNHDVDWKISNIDENTKESEFYNVISVEAGSLLLKKYIAECNVFSQNGIVEKNGCRIYSLNSSYFCYSSQQYKHGKIGKKQLEWLTKKLEEIDDLSNTWNLIIMHHHPFNYPFPELSGDISTLEEGADLLEILGRFDIDLICHGHRHHPKIFTQFTGGWKKPITFFCAGSLSVNEQHRLKGEIPNLFHLIELNKRNEANHAAEGLLRTFQFTSSKGWIPSRNNDTSIPIDNEAYFGSIETENQKLELLKQVIKDSIDSTKDNKVIRLPKYDTLPYALKCLRQEELNKHLETIVFEELKYKLVGNYPNEVGIFTDE